MQFLRKGKNSLRITRLDIKHMNILRFLMYSISVTMHFNANSKLTCDSVREWDIFIDQTREAVWSEHCPALNLMS